MGLEAVRKCKSISPFQEGTGSADPPCLKPARRRGMPCLGRSHFKSCCVSCTCLRVPSCCMQGLAPLSVLPPSRGVDVCSWNRREDMGVEKEMFLFYGEESG